VINQQAPPKEQNRAATPRDGYFKQLASPETLPQVILCLVGISGVIIAVCTLREIARQAGEMRHQRIVMRGQLGTMRRQLREMQTAGKQTDEMITQVTKQVGHLEKAAAAAKESADAAKLSADIATGVSIPTLRVEAFDFWDDGVATLEALFTPPKVKLVVKNYEKRQPS
jgi:hypothetical protein